MTLSQLPSSAQTAVKWRDKSGSMRLGSMTVTAALLRDSDQTFHGKIPNQEHRRKHQKIKENGPTEVGSFQLHGQGMKAIL